MAGNYPDAPSWRMAYDRDGSIGGRISSSGTITQFSSAVLTQLNDETNGLAVTIADRGQTAYLFVLFPELRDVDAVFTRNATPDPASLVEWQVSEDTTNGFDGTWVTLLPAVVSSHGSVSPGYRSPSSATALGVRGVRIKASPDGHTTQYEPSAVHLYGERTPGQALNALELWHPTNDEKLPPAWLDWGNTPRGSSEDRTFRVKNISTTSTAEDVRVAFDVLTDGAPSVPGQHLLSFGGGSFLAQVNVGDLAPGAISGPVTVRRVTASNAQLGLFAFRVFAEPDAWA